MTISNEYRTQENRTLQVLQHGYMQRSPNSLPWIRTSFVRQLTEAFIIPLKRIRLTEQIGEGMAIIITPVHNVIVIVHSDSIVILTAYYISLVIFKLVSGEFGIVYMGLLQTKQHGSSQQVPKKVAVKTLKGMM